MSEISGTDTNSKLLQLNRLLKELGKAAVAYSGGVDSTFLLKVAHNQLGINTIGIYVDSPLQPSSEKEEAIKMANSIGAGNYIVQINPLVKEEFRKNPQDRCYFCKRFIFGEIISTAKEKGFSNVVDGSNHDDKNDYRPGKRALKEYGIRSPLQEVGLTKEEIRKLSRELKLPTWDKDAYACLASRIPFNSEITEERLNQIDETEKILIGLGYHKVRARFFGSKVKIEVRSDQIKKLRKDLKSEQIQNAIYKIGFTGIMVDPLGYRQGSLNKPNQ